MRSKLLLAGIWLIACSRLTAYGQPLSGPETVSRYSIAKKKLLVVSTAEFINFLSQDNLDKDSLMLMACRITGLPFLLPYTDNYDSGSNSIGADLINTGQISRAIQLLKGLQGERRMQLLIKLAAWYLYKAGAHKTDLDSADNYIREALILSSAVGNKNGRYECLDLLGEYYHQSGKEPEAKAVFFDMVSFGQQEGNKKATASAWRHLGLLHAPTDSSDLVFLNNSLDLYQQLQLKEKEIELLWDIAFYYLHSDLNLCKSYLGRILETQRSTGYKHSLFAEFLLSLVDVQQLKNLDAMDHARAAFENMKWAGMSALQGTFYTRVGVAYLFVNQQQALAWFEKGLDHRSKETNLFWFKSLLYAIGVLVNMNRVEEALALMKRIVNEFPPVTTWEKGQVYTTEGILYERLKNYKAADENFMAFLRLSNESPDFDRYGEFMSDYVEIVNFYVSMSNVKAARLFLNKAMSSHSKWSGIYAMKNDVLYKMDSAVGNYRSALDHYIRAKAVHDSFNDIEQREKFDELTIKYGAEEKDKDIKLLQKEKQLQGAMLLQEKYTRWWMLGGMGLLLVIVGLLVYNIRLKKRTNKKLAAQQQSISTQNLALTHLVREKDWLVKEIHHRVKNNFQTVMGLLATQCGYLNSEIAITAIRDSQQRIQAMSLIHQLLYQSENLSGVNMSDYVYELVDFLRNSYTIGHRIRFNLEIEPIELDLTHCIPLGLILNEAISNSFKHAFPYPDLGTISITFNRTSANQLLLAVEDNGIGLPPGLGGTPTGSMGMNLIYGLSREIGADITIISLPGTSQAVAHCGTRIVVKFIYDPEATPDVKVFHVQN